MTNKPLGCLTPLGLAAALITLLVIGGAWAVQGGTMFSPGALNRVQGNPLGGYRSHAEIAGQCGACHTAPWDSANMTDRCLDCHEDIAISLNDPITLHGFLQSEASSQVLTVPRNCRECHTEHRGPDANLTTMASVDFPHDRTGFSLTGHPVQADGTPFACRDCHENYNHPPTSAVCTACHQQIDAAYTSQHAAVFGLACMDCHDGIDTYGDTFDHNRLEFALLGKHAEASCAGCHQGMTTLAALRDTPTDCFTCHRTDDMHEGQFGTDCAACHSPEGWLPATFDHSRSNFQLTGAHVAVDCAVCHVGDVFRGTPSSCAGCHAEPQVHAGLFGADCAACHSTDAWMPAGYNGPHSFPMNHGDADACSDCHVGSLTTWTCYTCHDQAEVIEEHQDEGISSFSNCMECHPNGEEDGGRDDDD